MVGKLWMTIIGLVTVVLLILTMLLVQFFDGFYYDQHSENLKTMANKVSVIFETYDDKNRALQTAKELVEVSRTSLTVLAPGGIVQESFDERVQDIHPQVFVSDPQLQRVFEEGIPIVERGHFSVTNTEEEIFEIDGIIVGVPLIMNGQQSGAVYLYQSLEVINKTTNEAKKLILYAAGIAIVLTTVFAFFLSTRITAPLRQMKSAAVRMAEGDFKSRVSHLTNDEIGDLSHTFNHMAAQLNDSIHALSQEKEQLSNILRSMADGVMTLDDKGNVVLMNPPAENMLNTWRYEESVTNKEALPKVFMNIYEKVIETEEEHVGAISAQGRYWTIIMAPLYNKEVIRGAVAVIRDMTDEKRLDKLRKDFLANVSHELRTPLSMMQGYSEALVDDIVASPEERKELSSIIYDESVRMGRLVNELLDLARMEAGHVELKLEKVEVDPIIQKTIKKFINLAKEQEVVLESNLVNTEHLYEVDADRLEQILTNLIDNAIRHTSKHGYVTVSSHEDDQYLYLSVRDNGDGIPEEDLPFIFERFYKADKARTRGKSGKGTGLGLSIVKHLVEAHGGQIQAHSKAGEGTTFSIQLPKA
ncbi:ATP-binding protein [Caldalkalibacillus salinus]|uniref:ATP-binding protein n=1 Tax=Caldalkalibacillus salinus TaxID=2803787 RepID=UPI0030188C93